MKELSQVHFRVIDHGLFLPIARRLSREAARVSYFTPNERAFPTVRDLIGDGFDDIEVVDCLWEGKDSVDCWVFPDIGFNGIQKELVSQGALVWGARDADEIEIDRAKFLEVLGETDLPVPPNTTIEGMSKLREYLSDKKDKWIKVSRWRGDWETLHFRNWAQDEMELDIRAVKLGPWKEQITFHVFDQIETEIEDGCDTYCVDGEFPALILHGMEAKDKAYLGAFQRYSDLPPEVRCVTEAFGPVLGAYDYRSFFSCEVRITRDGKSYFIDPTLRAGSPPSQVMCELVDNLGEIIWSGANGALVDPYPYAKFGVQAMVNAPGDRCAWTALEIPDELDRWFKAGNCSFEDRRICFAPDPDAVGHDVGWLVGVGDTIEESLTHLKHNVGLLPPGASCDIAPLAELLREIREAEASGMEFTDQKVPEPESVIEED